MKCVFCSDDAIARVALSDGCLVRPDDREQDLCWHHLKRSTPNGGMAIIEDYTLPGGMRLEEALA